jgi:hypothetical protein
MCRKSCHERARQIAVMVQNYTDHHCKTGYVFAGTSALTDKNIRDYS